jgi:hypothetical protein
MDNGRNPFERRLLVHLVDGQAIRLVVDGRQIGPAAGHDRATSQCTRGRDDHLADILRRPHAAETEIDGRAASGWTSPRDPIVDNSTRTGSLNSEV